QADSSGPPPDRDHASERRQCRPDPTQRAHFRGGAGAEALHPAARQSLRRRMAEDARTANGDEGVDVMRPEVLRVALEAKGFLSQDDGMRLFDLAYESSALGPVVE